MVTKVFINIHEDFLEDFIDTIYIEGRDEEFKRESEFVFSIAFPPEMYYFEAEIEANDLMFQLGFVVGEHYTIMDETQEFV